MIDFQAKTPVDSIYGLTGLVAATHRTHNRSRIALYFIEISIHFDVRHDERY